MLKKAMKFSLILAVGFCFFLRTAYSKELIFKWGMTEDAYSSSTQLNDRLEVSLLQENVRYKVEKALMALEIPYRLFVEAKLLPCQFSVFFYDKEDGKLDEFKDFLAKEPSCFLEEFDLVKERWIEWAQKESRLDEFSKFSIFLKKAEKIVREISEQKLFSILQKNKKDEDFPSHFFIQNYLEEFEVPSGDSDVEGFFSLSLTEEDKKIIREFVFCLSSKSIIQLALDRGSLEAIKNRIKVVHPLRFIAFILTDGSLRQTLESIYKTDFKWTFLVMGLERGLRRKKESKALNEYVFGFADLLKVDEKVIRSYIDHDNFKEIFNYLICH